LLLSVEAWHTLPNTSLALENSKRLLDSSSEQSRLIIADGFAVEKLQAIEAEFSQNFEIESKTDISYNVRSARYLSVERQNKIVERTL
jgi:hypothetical protein